MKIIVGLLIVASAVQSFLIFSMHFSGHDFVQAQREAIDKIKFQLILDDKPCFVDYEEGIAYAKLDLKTEKMVKCDVDKFKKRHVTKLKLLNTYQ